MASSSQRTTSPVRRSLWPRVTLLVFALLLLILFALGGWLFGSESGARTVLAMLASRSAGVVRVDGIHGRLAGPLMLDHVIVERPSQHIALDNVRLDWDSLALLNAELHVTALRIGHLTVTSKVEQKPEPAKMPDSISLPLALQIDKAQIDAGDIGWGPVNIIKLSAFEFNLDFDGRRYRLRLDQLALGSGSGTDAINGDLSGLVTLGTTKPYALHADFASGGTAVLKSQAIGAKGRINLDGSLAEFAANVDLAINQAHVRGHALLRPFSEQVLGNAELNAQALDLSAFRPDLPHTDIDARLSTAASGTGQLAVTNRAAGLYNEGKVPLTELHVSFRQSAGAFLFDRIRSTLGGAKQQAGAVTGNGRYANGALTLDLSVDALDLHSLDQRVRATRLSGKVDLHHANGKQALAVDLREPLGKQNATLVARATLADARLAIERAEFQLGTARLNAAGHFDLSGQQTFSAQGKISRLRLQDLGQFSQFPTLDLNGMFSLHGARLPRLVADLEFNINDSQLAGRTLQGDGQARLLADRIVVPKFLLVAGDNRLDIHGELSQGEAQLTFGLMAPKLEQLGTDFGGALKASGNARGSFTKPHVNLAWTGSNVRLPGQLQAEHTQGKVDIVVDRSKPFFVNAAAVEASGRGLKAAAQQLAVLSARLQFAPQPNAPLMLDVRAEGISTPQLRADRFNATIQGTTSQHVLNATLVESPQTQNWMFNANGGLQQAEQAIRWQGSIDRLDASGRFTAHLASPAALFVSPQRMQLDHFQLDANTAYITVEQFRRDATGIVTRGRVDKLQLAQVLKFAEPQPPLTTDLQLSGDWDVNITNTLKGNINVRRQSGDITVRGGAPVTLGLRSLDAVATAANGQLDLRLNIDGQQLGRIEMNMRTTTGGGPNRFGISSNAPLAGSAKIDIPSLAWIAPLVSPTAISEGRLQSDVSIGGTLSRPQLAGRIAGNSLRLFYGDLGVDLRQGKLDSEFRGDTLFVNSLAFQNNQGTINASGSVGFAGTKPDAQFTLQAQRYPLLNRSDRKLVVSGLSKLVLREGRTNVTGAFDIDSGFFDIGRADMPRLSDDVVVVGKNKKSSGAIAAAIDVNINLGKGVALQGRGLDAVLVGQIHLTSGPNETLRAQGTVQIEKGTYSAYGRKLAIEQGVLRFNGPLNNPALDIVAMRRDQEVEAGVAVRGTVLAPRVTLVSDPPVPDAEKLSWLVLGHTLDTAGSGDLSALQSAAGALLSQGAASGVQSQLANAFGLDVVSVGTSQDNLQQRIVTLGKRISSRLYVSYEQSLQAVGSVLLLRYTLSPRLSLEAEAGTRSALSLFYNVSFD